MENLHVVLARIEAAALAEGTTPARLVRRITGNPRGYERLKNRLVKTEAVIRLLESYLKSRAEKHNLASGGAVPGLQEAAE